MAFVDVGSRASIEAALRHAFIATGSPPASPAIRDPLSLHLTAPLCRVVTSPRRDPATGGASGDGSADSASGGDDGGWKRRQLSVLIAPMPNQSDYQLGGTGTGGSHSLYIPGVTIYTMSAIVETQFEMGSSFV